MNRRGIKAGDAYVEVSIRDRLEQGIRGIQSKLDRFAGSVGRLGGVLASSSLASVGIFGTLANSFANAGNEVSKMAQRSGVAVERFSALGYAAQESGADLERLEDLLREISIKRFDANDGSEALEFFEKLGISAERLNSLSVEDQLYEIADAVSRLENVGDQVGIVDALFSDAGVELLPLLTRGADGIKALAKEAEQLGIVIREKDSVAAEELTNALNKVQSVVKAVSIGIGGALAPAFTEVANAIAAGSKSVIDFIQENQSLVRGIFGVVAAIGVAGGGLLLFAGAAKLAAIGLGVASGAMAAFSTISGLATATVGVFEAVILSVSGALAFATGTASGMAAGVALLTAAETANAGVASLMVGIYTALGGVTAVLTSGMGPLTAATSLWATVSAAAGAAAAVAFAPITLIIFGVTAAIGVLVGVMALAAVRAFNFAGTFETVRNTLGGVASTFSQVFDAVRAAITSGETEQISRALWASVRLIWYRGIQGTLDLSKEAFFGFLGFMKRFFGELISIAIESVTILFDTFIRPWKILERINGIVDRITSIGSGGFSISANVESAEAELRAVRDALATDKERTEEAGKRKGLLDGLAGLASIDGGGIDDEESAATRREELLRSRLQQLEQERIAITQGADAAENAAIRNLDLEREQIKLLLQRTQQLREIKKAQEETQRRQDQRVDAVFERANQFAERGVGPAEIFARVTGQINKDLAAGLIDEEDATNARQRARDNRDQAAEQLRREAGAIAEALKTADEKLRDEIARIQFLEKQGALDPKTADKAEKAARGKFAEQQEQIAKAKAAEEDRVKQESSRTERARNDFRAPELSTTSGFALSAQALNAFGASIEDKQLDQLMLIAGNTETMAKQRTGYAE